MMILEDFFIWLLPEDKFYIKDDNCIIMSSEFDFSKSFSVSWKSVEWRVESKNELKSKEETVFSS